jgi:2-succinyl-6-hydroxy-2,4-cyclohexadiene-1-carboxylate synthase
MPQMRLASYKIHYERYGDFHRPKVVFLHGFMGCGDDFLPIINALLPNVCCLTVDLPGHGQTEVLDSVGYGMGAIAPALINLLQALNFTPCHLMGYSMGGRLGLYLACQFPQHFTSAFLESASPGLVTDIERVLRQQQDEILATELESEDWPTVLARWYAQPLFDSLRHSPQFEEMRQRRLHNRPHQLAQTLRGLGTGMQPSLWNAMAALTMPMTLVVGECDQKFVQINQSMAVQQPLAQLKILPDCGHAAHAEDPAAFEAALQAHLRQAQQVQTPSIPCQ